MHDRVRFLALLALLTIAAFGQSPRSTATATASSSTIGWTVSFGGGSFAGPAVTGEPYSAEEVTERVQTLADGTHITHQSTTVRIYRDSEGRIRTERTMPRPAAQGQPDGTDAPALVEIADPVAHVMYMLSAADKVAHKRSLPALESRPAVRRNASGGAAPFFQNGPQIRTSRQIPDAEGPKIAIEKLGSQNIEGVPVEGTRRTTTWPVGSRGNDRPITVVNETWMSPELRVVVLSKDSNPIIGDSTRKLTNINRGEPDPSLFQPPPDYTVVSQETESGLQH